MNIHGVQNIKNLMPDFETIAHRLKIRPFHPIITVMRKLIKFMVAVLLVLCLPLQGVAGVTMPACAGHEPASVQAQTVDDGMSEHCKHMQQAMAEKTHDQTHKASHDKCYACYISVAQAIAPSIMPVAPAMAGTAYPVMAQNDYQTRLSTPYHPPRLTSAQG